MNNETSNLNFIYHQINVKINLCATNEEHIREDFKRKKIQLQFSNGGLDPSNWRKKMEKMIKFCGG
jgi:hypothetical protein